MIANVILRFFFCWFEKENVITWWYRDKNNLNILSVMCCKSFVYIFAHTPYFFPPKWVLKTRITTNFDTINFYTKVFWTLSQVWENKKRVYGVTLVQKTKTKSKSKIYLTYMPSISSYLVATDKFPADVSQTFQWLV